MKTKTAIELHKEMYENRCRENAWLRAYDLRRLPQDTGKIHPTKKQGPERVITKEELKKILEKASQSVI